MAVRLLDHDTIEKIAAGEVVERPASIVKELVENSIDAGAHTIEVEIGKGGTKLILVQDDGCGMARDDAELAFHRHATSKIEHIDDLESTRTLGFRGEALPSIAAVARLEMKTRAKGEIGGTRIVIEGGEMKKMEDVGCSEGTNLKVKDLFFNTPARKKFMKSTLTETTHCIDVVTRFALAYPDISFSLMRDSKEALNLPATTDTRERIMGIYGREVARDMVVIEARGGISGAISKPSTTRSSRDFISVFVNRRFVKSTLIRRAVYEGYRTLLPRGRSPIAMIDIEIDPALIDVNVHPAKVQIKFKDEKQIYWAVVDAIRGALKGTRLAPKITSEVGKTTRLTTLTQTAFDTGVVREEGEEYGTLPEADRPTPLTSTTTSAAIKPLPDLKPIGQIHDSYIIAEHDGGMAIIDQHAAHERIRYEGILKKKEGIKGQELISPFVFDAAPKEAVAIEGNQELLEEMGFRIEPMGGKSFAVKALPVIYGTIEDPESVKDIVSELAALGEVKALDERREALAALMACRPAVKAGDAMLMDSMEQLISALAKTDNPYTCPHGRPTMIEMDMTEIEKRFKRR
jgi:DNA mismatch repair protein MutL